MSDNAAPENDIIPQAITFCPCYYSAVSTNNSLNLKQCLCPRRDDQLTFTLGEPLLRLAGLRGPFVSVGVKRKGFFVSYLQRITDAIRGALLVPTAE